MIGVWPERFHVRFSGWNGPRNGSVVIEQGEATDHVVCPAQTDPTGERCCGNCTFCWATDKTIAFLRHRMMTAISWCSCELGGGHG
jgi:hypothetical protein